MRDGCLGRQMCALIAFLATAIGAVSSSAAAQLVENDQLELSLGGYAQVLTGAEFPEDRDANYGASLSLARLKLSGRHPGYTNFAVQIGESGGNMVILDAMAEWTAFDPIYVRAGRFKTSVSREYLLSAARLKFVSRALLNQFVPNRRLGVETYGRFEFGGMRFQPQIGIFQPATTSLQDPQGQLLTARLLVETPIGVGFHAGYAGHVFDENRLPGTSGATSEEPGTLRVLPYDDPIDLAVTYREDRLDLHLEGTAVLDSPTEESAAAGYAHAAYRFGPEGDIQYEPALAYDIVKIGNLAHRVTGGLNVYWWDTHFYNILDYRYLTDGERQVHSVFLQFHGEI